MGEDYFFYVDQDLNCKLLNNYPMSQDFEILAFEVKISKTNWLIIGTYKPPSLSDNVFTPELILTFYWLTHENILFMGDINMALDNPNFNQLFEGNGLSTLMSESTCFKSINPTCIGNFLTSKKLVL